MLTPHSIEEIRDAVRSVDCVLPVGARTKPSLAVSDAADVAYIDMRSYAGVVSYDPGEYLVTVRAGTKVRDVALVLLAQGQYLPFDPCFMNDGSTIGGSVASGISGPCRLLYGGLRDFMLEVALIDSLGREIRGGGKVVKNAAGFDLPKLLVGSYGRLGIMTEVTLKVFPSPPAWSTVRVSGLDIGTAVQSMQRVLGCPLPIAAAEIDDARRLNIRLAGPLDSLSKMIDRVRLCLPSSAQSEILQNGDSETAFWRDLAEFTWTGGRSYLIRAAVTQQQIPWLDRALVDCADSLRHIYSCGGSVCWIAADDLSTVQSLNRILSDHRISGMVVRGSVPNLLPLGDSRWIAFSERIRKALDPAEKFPAYRADAAAV